VGKDLSPKGYSRIINIPVFDSNNFLAGEYPPTITSTEAKAPEYGVSFYPNPVEDKLNIRIENNILGTYEVNVYETSGSKVLAESLTKASALLDVSLNIDKLAKGLYLVEVKNGETKTVKKIIKK
jgi:hypothetical protein